MHPSPDGDVEVDDPYSRHALIRGATDTHNVVTFSFGVMAFGSECDTYVARIY